MRRDLGDLAAHNPPQTPLRPQPRGVSITTQTAVSIYLADLIARVGAGAAAPSTARAYERGLRVGLMAHFGDRPLAQISVEDACNMVATLSEANGPSVANRARQAANLAWRHAQRAGLITSPTPFRDAPKCPTDERAFPTDRDATQAAIALCIGALAGDRVVPAVSAAALGLLALTGVRLSEGVAAQWSDISIERRTLTVRKHKTSRKYGAKVVPLSQEALLWVEMVRKSQWSDRWLFPSTRSRLGHLKDPTRSWKTICRLAGIPAETRIHDLRHGFAEAAYAACKDLKLVQSLMSHADVATTSRYVGRLKIAVTRPLADATTSGLLGGAR
jgi:integrase